VLSDVRCKANFRCISGLQHVGRSLTELYINFIGFSPRNQLSVFPSFSDVLSFLSLVKVKVRWRMSLTWHVARMREKLNAYRIILGKSEGKRPVGRQ
jgi:hypothetical protein